MAVADGDEAMASHAGAAKAKRLSMASVAMAGLTRRLNGGQQATQTQALLVEADEETDDDDEGPDAELEDTTMSNVAQIASRSSPRTKKSSRPTMNPLLASNQPGALLRGRSK